MGGAAGQRGRLWRHAPADFGRHRQTGTIYARAGDNRRVAFGRYGAYFIMKLFMKPMT